VFVNKVLLLYCHEYCRVHTTEKSGQDSEESDQIIKTELEDQPEQKVEEGLC